MTKVKECISVADLQAKKSKLFDEMGKYPEREQELAQEYFSIDQQIIQFYKKQNGVLPS